MCGLCLPSLGGIFSSSQRSALLDARERRLKEDEARLRREWDQLAALKNRLEASAESRLGSAPVLESGSPVGYRARIDEEASRSPCRVTEYRRSTPRAIGKLDFAHADPEENLQKILRLYDEHKIMLAGSLLKELQRKQMESGRPFVAGTNPKVQRLNALHDRMVKLRERLQEIDGWEPVREAFGITVRYRPLESGSVRVRMDAEIQAPVFDILSLLREVDLWKSWVPSFGGVSLSESTELEQTSFMNMCFHCSLRFPRPILDRHWTLAVDAIDSIDTEDSPRQIAILLSPRLSKTGNS